MTALLVGTDGVHKMSKSLGNYIGVDESPDEIYGKVMALADNMIIQYFELLTDVSDSELMDFKRQIAGNAINPMVLKNAWPWNWSRSCTDMTPPSKPTSILPMFFRNGKCRRNRRNYSRRR